MDTGKIKILIVDDEPDIIEFLKYNLLKGGYDVHIARNGIAALSMADKVMPDLILLDIMMPEIDGIETCRILRENPKFENTIIVFLTARGEDYSEVAGFDVGADDYITKPIRIRALLARLKSLLKRKVVNEKSEEILTFQDLVIDKEKRLVSCAGEERKLTKKEFEILLLLSSKPDKVFTREFIYQKIWGSNIFVGDRTLDVHIRKLREKIGVNYIKTSKGIGYAFNY